MSVEDDFFELFVDDNQFIQEQDVVAMQSTDKTKLIIQEVYPSRVLIDIFLYIIKLKQQMATKEDTPQDTDGGHHQTPSESLEQHYRLMEEEVQNLRESETSLRQQYADSQRRERILVRRLAAKEQEMQDYANQIAELKSSQAPGPNTLRNALLDPAVNILFQKLKSELQSTKAKMEETQNELSAWKFTPDSNNGKRLMAKCRLLHQENEELGKMTSNGRLAKLEADLALQKSFSEEVKKSQSELDDFLQELDEDVEGMQSTIFFLQQELKAAKDTISSLESEINLLKQSSNCNSPCVVNGSTNKNSISEIDVNNLSINNETSETRTPNLINNGIKHNNYNDGNILKRTNIIKYYNGDTEMIVTKVDEQIIDNNTIIKCNNLSLNNSNNNNELTNNISILNKRNRNNYDSDSSEYNSSNELETSSSNKKKKKSNKKPRRSSFLSIDLNDDDSEMVVDVDHETDNNKLSTASSNGTVKQILTNDTE